MGGAEMLSMKTTVDLSMAEPQSNHANADGMRTCDFPIDEEAVTPDRVSQWLKTDPVTLHNAADTSICCEATTGDLHLGAYVEFSFAQCDY